MSKRIIIILVSLMIIWAISSSQIQYPGIPLSSSFVLKQDVQTLSMPAVNVKTLLAEDSADAQNKNIPYRFGYPFMVDVGITNAGTWDTLFGGYKVWRLRIESIGAFSINLIFNRFFLPSGSSVFVYNEDRSMVIGAFNEKNNREDKLFATAPVKGDRIIIECNLPASVNEMPELNISVIVHAYKDILSLFGKGANGFGDSGPCHFNVACPEGESWRVQARSVAMVLLSNNTRICSGSLINNVRNDGTPYFLTAEHCMTMSATDPSTWIFMFRYESSTCSNTTQEPPTLYTISGSTLRARNSDTDFLLLQLSSTPPISYNVYYAGWNRQDVAATSGAGIHHPRGDIKKISFSNSSFISSNSYWRVNWSQVSGKTAVTEPASSGSPIFDQNKRIVGQLYGGPSYCGAPSYLLYDYYGKFSISWDRGSSSSSRLKDWLDPDNTGETSIDGCEPIEVTVDQKRSNDQQLIGTPVGRWEGGPNFAQYIVPIPPFNFTVGSKQILQGYQQLVSNPYEKYRVWERNQVAQLDNVQNHRGFTISIDDANLTSRFHPTDPTITIRNELIDAPAVNGGRVELKDPWLVDVSDSLFYDHPYGYRNLGMEAPFKSETSPFRPTLQSKYKGVFLNQGGPDPNNLTPPYYSVRVPQSQIIYSKAMCFGFLLTRLFKNISREGAKVTELHSVSFTEFYFILTPKE